MKMGWGRPEKESPGNSDLLAVGDGVKFRKRKPWAQA